MKKIFLFSVLCSLFSIICLAEDYGIKVGGVSVTSVNSENVTGSNIKAYKEGESYYVKYNFATKTLTLKNVKIERTGSDNRAIYNTGCDGLTIVLDGAAYLKAANSSAVRCEKNTTIKCKNVGVLEDFYIGGDQENAIYLTNGITLTFDGAAVWISGGSNSSAIEGKNATEKIVVKNSSLYIGIDTGNEYYALRDIGSLQVQASAIRMAGRTAYQSPVKNLKAFSLSSDTYVLPSVDGEIVYNSTKGTFVLKSSGEEYKNYIRISEAVPIDEAHFPDATFRSEIRVKINDTYIIQKNPLGVDGDHIGVLKIYDNTTAMSNITIPSKGITSLKGIEYLPHVGVLYCQDNSLTSLDLSKNKKLKNLDCSNNQLTTLKLPTSAPLASIACYNNKLTSLNLASFSSTLQAVYCRDNMLTSLTFPSSASLLTFVECCNNQLTSLKMPTDVEHLTTLSCYGNRIKGNGTWEFVRSLYTAPTERMVYFVDHSNANEQNECTAEQCYMAKSGKWLLCHNYNGGWRATTACPHPHSIYYVVDGKVIFYKPDVLTGSVITPAEAPQKEGYTFSRWDGMPTVMPDSNVTVTAVYTLNQYTLTYVIDGEIYRSQSVDYGATITPLAEPKREGYTFSGWSEIPATMPAHDVTITATFADNPHTLTFMIDEDIYSSHIYSYGAEILVPVVEEKVGYTFSGWGDVAPTMPDNDLVYRAYYYVNQYKLTYLIDGVVYKTLNVDYGSAITPLSTAEDDDYFYAWEDEPATMPAHDVEVHAVITALQSQESRAKGQESDIYYDLQGHKVTNPVKGKIYILNGKKIIYK